MAPMTVPLDSPPFTGYAEKGVPTYE